MRTRNLALLLFTFLFILSSVSCKKTGNQTENIINEPEFETYPIESILLSGDGGEFVIEYTLINPVEGTVAIVNFESEWISLIENSIGTIPEENRLRGKITFAYQENNESDSRNASISVSYADKIEFEIEVIQSGKNNSEQIDFVANYIYGYYYGEDYSPGAGNYWIVLSDKYVEDYDNTFYRIDLYGSLSDVEYGSGSSITIPVGTYTLDKENSYSQGTFSDEYSMYWQVDANGAVITGDGNALRYEEGIVTITEKELRLEVVIEGKKHVVTYNGDMGLIDRRKSPYLSTLQENIEVNLGENSIANAYCYQDYYELGTTNWILFITPENGIGEYLLIDLNTNYQYEEDGYSGNYDIVSNNNIASGTATGGFISNSYMQGSWWYTSEDSISINQMAPFSSGSVTITDNEDGTVTISLNLYDDIGYAITGTWTGNFTVAPTEQTSIKRNFVDISIK